MEKNRYFSEDYCKILSEYGGKKYKDFDKEIENKFKRMREEFRVFTDKIVNYEYELEIEIAKRGIGQWQISGYLAEYLWNRYQIKGQATNINLYLYFTIKSDGIYLVIGFNNNNLSEFEIENRDKIGENLRTKISKGDYPKFRLKDSGNELVYERKIESIKNLNVFIETFRKLKKIYEEVLSEEYINLDLEINEVINNDYVEIKKIISKPQFLNQILYGPPGTGKTYNTINKALEIIDKDFYEENIDDRIALKEKFNEYKENGQIEFITFHQSYGYEEFVEGIKAIPAGKGGNDTNEMIYDVVDGVFKKLSKRAKVIKSQSTLQNFNWDKDNIFKMSLGGKYDENVLEWCLENGYISMGWGLNIDFSEINENNWEEFRDKSKVLMQDKIEDNDIRFTTQAMYAFKKWMKINDLVFISVGNLKIVAIGQIIGNYEFKDNIEEISYMQYRKVKWLFIDRGGIATETLLNKKISYQTIYNLNKEYIKKEFFNTLFQSESPKIKPYVLIIDEINRGNISKIFGELITLIEDSKRLGNEEELEITLPYSGEKFGVPKNLYILGTMNTADRSIALMDTALRRRFDFEEMMPNHNLESIEMDIEGINLQEVLRVINQRIEYLYDRDHMIGHAYFIGIKTKEELDNVMRNKIIPLLQEYFYDDWEKIQIVLGDHKEQYKKIDDRDNRFIISKELKEKAILGFDYDDIDEDNISYTINTEFYEQSYIKIYNNSFNGEQDENE